MNVLKGFCGAILGVALSVSALHATIATSGNLTAASGVPYDGVANPWNTDALVVGVSAPGSLSITGGYVVMNSGSATIASLVGASTSTATVDGPGSAWTNSNGLFIGPRGTATLSISGGGVVSDTIADIEMGAVTVGGGTGNSTWTNFILEIGNSLSTTATATLSITGGGTVSDIIGVLGSGNSGTVTVGGGTGNSTWTNSGALTLGDGFYPDSSGTLNIDTGGLVSASSLDGGTSTSSAIFNGGTLSITGTDSASNTINLQSAGGTIDVPTVGTTFTITSAITGAGGLTKTGQATLALTGAYSYDGDTTVNGGTLLLNSAGAGAGSLNINISGTVRAVSLDGTSSVNFNGGTLSIVGTDSASNPINLLAGGGTIDVPTASTTFTITNGITGAGGLTKTGMGTLVLSETNSFEGATTINGGILAMSDWHDEILDPVKVNAGGTLAGTGNIRNAVTVASGGALAPGDSSTLLDMDSLALAAGAQTTIEIGGVTCGGCYNFLGVGTASVGGNLSVVGSSFGSSFFAPTVGQTFGFLSTDMDGLTGTFDVGNSTWVVAGERIHFSVTYTGQDATITVTAIDTLTPGDFNGDGKVDARDYVVWRDTLGTHLSAADADHSGTVDANDYGIWRAHFGSTTPPTVGSGAKAGGSVPEPATSVAAIVAMLAAFIGRGWTRKRV